MVTSLALFLDMGSVDFKFDLVVMKSIVEVEVEYHRDNTAFEIHWQLTFVGNPSKMNWFNVKMGSVVALVQNRAQIQGM